MLNISPNRINDRIKTERYSALFNIEQRRSGKVFLRLLTGFFLLFFLILFIPWTQNIRSAGNVTTIKPDQRPQTIHSVIAGRIEKWFVQEGDFVEKGDTILFISEIKDDYFDPNFLQRAGEQLESKEMAVSSYMQKIQALDTQIDALIQTSQLKFQQAENKLKQAHLKVQSDSIDYQASQLNYKVIVEQYERMEKLYNDGLKSLTDLENRRVKMQKSQADMISAENKLLTSQNEIINAQVELISIQAQYVDDISKAESEKFTAFSNMYDAEAVVTKLQNQFMNYSVRSGLYYITAPQTGYITKAIQFGIGETLKEGSDIVSIMPEKFDLAVEMYIKPIDLPLIEVGQDVRIQFDGWPAIVFSGWPNTSYGTYGGTVYAMDKFISDNGMYRLLVQPNQEQVPWPDALSIGAGTTNMVLLKDVPIWYEIWRKISGFPPDYYKTTVSENTNKK
jgi:multidrug resistance efflux pump